MDMSMPDHSQHGAYYHSVPPPQHQPPPPPQYHHPYFGAAPAAAPWQPPPPPPPTYAHTQPKLTTSIWEDQNTLCFQVDARGICVSRRNDNDMINGTKLLNVAGISRGKRDGILKNEKTRVVVKVGAMHLKGVWITFYRAKQLAEQFDILNLLYPLFEEDPLRFATSSYRQTQDDWFSDQQLVMSGSSIISDSAPGTPEAPMFPPHDTSAVTMTAPTYHHHPMAMDFSQFDKDELFYFYTN
ncbi:hypothetical protein VTP01DRAFT_3788 [Rhizomucor pusillus]|uniref:uncharacterized protein n=1 Tax=Rhizomucor pusillus TaxID=4840 RepID=UPI0037437E21